MRVQRQTCAGSLAHAKARGIFSTHQNIREILLCTAQWAAGGPHPGQKCPAESAAMASVTAGCFRHLCYRGNRQEERVIEGSPSCAGKLPLGGEPLLLHHHKRTMQRPVPSILCLAHTGSHALCAACTL